ncbi:hypothetical protein [Caedibacter taeniospiralis]|jgi:hypothetical protein|uniref:hypothetical protein n=1 Tax=Caedibacter taeniospiralis TaxID=28907 RepID=UPI0037C11829
MTKGERQYAILQHLSITQWQVKRQKKNNAEFVSHAHTVDTNKLCVILCLASQETLLSTFVKAMFSCKDVCYIEVNDKALEKGIASNTIILYDESLDLANFLDENPHAGSLAINIDKLNCAEVKKQMMMSVYAVSDFAPK